MPKALERKLTKTAKNRHYGKKRTNAFVYGTLRSLGWSPKGERNESTRQSSYRILAA